MERLTDGRITLNCILNKYSTWMWNGFIWPWTGSSDGLSRTHKWTFEFHKKMWGLLSDYSFSETLIHKVSCQFWSLHSILIWKTHNLNFPACDHNFSPLHSKRLVTTDYWRGTVMISPGRPTLLLQQKTVTEREEKTSHPW